MVMGPEATQRSLCPGHRQSQALFRAGAISRILGALVEGHGDVGAERDLDVHGVLGSKEVAAPIQMGPETDAFVGNLAQFAQGENLETP